MKKIEKEFFFYAKYLKFVGFIDVNSTGTKHGLLISEKIETEYNVIIFPNWFFNYFFF